MLRLILRCGADLR